MSKRPQSTAFPAPDLGTTGEVEKKLKGEGKSQETKTRKREAGWGVDWSTKFIPIPTGEVKQLWSAASHDIEFQDVEGKKFEIIAARTKYTTAILKEQAKYDHRYREIVPETPLVTFRTDVEVVRYLSTRATHVSVTSSHLLRYRTANNKYLDPKDNRTEEKEEAPEVDDSDAAMWKLFAAKQKKDLEKHQQLPFTCAENVAREFLLADSGLLMITKQLLAAWTRDKGMTVDDHNGGDQEYHVKVVTLARYEHKMLPSAVEAHWYEHGLGATYHAPAMSIKRRQHDVHHRNHDSAWISVWNYCGNPYYIDKKDGRVHLSTCASGISKRLNLESPPFTGCFDAGHIRLSGNEGDDVMRHTSLTLERLQAVVDKIDANTATSFITISVPSTSTTSTSGGASLVLLTTPPPPIIEASSSTPTL